MAFPLINISTSNAGIGRNFVLYHGNGTSLIFCEYGFIFGPTPIIDFKINRPDLIEMLTTILV
jgi:hypothetical protein